MPWGAPRLHDDSVLCAIKPVLCLDETRACGLKWADGVSSPRALTGMPAGTYSERLQQWLVTAKGWPLYSRHAVWMLANDQPIPRGQDIFAIDGDLSSLRDPSNLVARDHAARGSSNTDEHVQSTTRRAKMPTGFTYEASSFGSYQINIVLRNIKIPIATVHTPKQALCAAMHAAVCFGYLPDTGVPLLTGVKDIVTTICADIYTPDGEPLTPAMQNRVRDFNLMLSAAAKTLRERHAI